MTRDITRLPAGQALTVAEFSAAGVGVWKIASDKSGIPVVRWWSYEWSVLRGWDLLSEGELLDRIQPEDDARLVLARTGARTADLADAGERAADRAFAVARVHYPHVPAFETAADVDDLIGEATARVPLPASLWYELVVLRRRPSGRLELTAQQLFLPGARRGDTRPVVLRCAASDSYGTAFAVVARDAAQSFELVSMASALIPPGTYDVTAELARPGVVRFDGLPSRLQPARRSWPEIRAAVPDFLDEIEPAHLIVAVERSGDEDEVQARLDRAAQLLEEVRGAAAPVTCSLVSYASHAHERKIRDEPVTVHAWQANPGLAELELQALRGRGPVPPVYFGAAQVECMLAVVVDRLRARGAPAGRPVLVTIGDRPPFPPRVDPRTAILPCPQRNSWLTSLTWLVNEHRGMAFGVIRDGDFPGDPAADPFADVWRRLGVSGSAHLSQFDPRRFATALGLISPSPQHLPLPLIALEGVG